MNEPVWRRYARLVRPRTAEDVDAELALHVDMRIRDYMAMGMSEDDARAKTLQRIGDLAAARRACIDITTRREHRMLRAQLWDAFVQDVRFALRTLGRQKGWTLAGVLTLALGIGATTAVFSTVSSLLLHPLNYRDTRGLAFVFQRPSTGNNTGISIQITPSSPSYRAWKNAHSFAELQAWMPGEVAMQLNGASMRLASAEVQSDLSRFTGIQPLLGRGLLPEDTHSHNLAISESLWRTRFAADTGILHRTISLDGEVWQIVGVMPAAFQLPALVQQRTDIWKPIDLSSDDLGLSVMGRLRPGVTYAEAAADLDSASAHAHVRDGGMGFRAVVIPPRAMVHFEDTLRMLTLAVALVLIIACANVAHLLLARGAARQRELAVRAALGAGIGRLRRQLLTESLILAVLGCAGGIALGEAGLSAIRALRPDGLSQLDMAHLDLTTLVVTIGLALLSGMVFGLVGSSQSAQLSQPDGLRAGSRGASSGRSHNRLRSLLVVTEMALSTALLVGAALLVRGIMRLQSIDPGFRPQGLYAVSPQLPTRITPYAATRDRYVGEFASRARAVPGVDAITEAAGVPPSSNFMLGTIQFDGDPPPPAGTSAFVAYNAVTPDYFDFMGIPFIQGTTFTDTTKASGQVIINEGMAKSRWPHESAIGKRLRVVFNGTGDWLTVVGVVKNAFTGGFLMEGSAPMLYEGMYSTSSRDVLLRISRPQVALPALNQILAQISPNVPPVDIVNVEAAMKDSIAAPRFTMTLITTFTMLAVLLAAVGLYGLVSYAVTQRTREIGIRIALGATRRRIARAVLAQGLVLGVGGLALGLIVARLGVRIIANQLNGISPTDPASFTAAGVALLVTVLLACLVPMARAVSVPPQIAMQAE